MSTNNTSKPKLIAAILLFAYSALRLIWISGFSNIRALLWIVALIAVGVGLLIGQHIVSVIGLGVGGLLELIWALQNATSSYPYWQGVIYDLANCVALLMLMAMLLPDISSSMKNSFGDLKKLWFLPGAISTVGFLIYIFEDASFYFSNGFKYLFCDLLLIAGLFLAGYSICNDESPALTPAAGMAAAPAAGTPATAVQPQQQKGFTEDKIVALRKLKDLLDDGVINEEDFKEQKKKLLG